MLYVSCKYIMLVLGRLEKFGYIHRQLQATDDICDSAHAKVCQLNQYLTGTCTHMKCQSY
jgi:hypothetical protein